MLRASREHVFAFVAHAEHLPRYGAPLWLAADLEDRRGDLLITLRGYFAGLPVESVIRAASRPPQSVDIAQVRGTLRGFSQHFRIESGDEGTVLSCRVEADPGIPMLSDEAAKHFLTQYVERMLDRLRLAAERRTPSRRLARPAAKEAEALLEPEAAEADADAAAAPAGETTATDLEGASASRPAPRPSPQRRPRAPHFGPARSRAAAPPPRETAVSNGTGAEPAQAGGADTPSPEPGRRRRRRRRRRGRGGPGAGAAGGPSSVGAL